MKFRYRGGSKGFIARTAGRVVKRAYIGGSKSNDTVGCLLVILLAFALATSPLWILLLAVSLPYIVLVLAVIWLIALCIFAIKKQYPQIFLSWFFLREDEQDGTILPVGEVQSRVREYLHTTDRDN